MQFQSIQWTESQRCYKQEPVPPFYCQYTRYEQSYRTQADMHYHDYPEFGICLHGSGIFFVEDRVYPFSAGCMTYFPAGMLHIAQSPVDHHSTWIYLWQDPDAADPLLPTREIITYDKDCQSITELLYRCARRSAEEETAYYRTLYASLIYRLYLCERDMDGVGEASVREKILPAITLIAEQYNEDLPVSVLARACGVSESVLRRLFRQATGMSPADYLVSVRILMAKNLLRNTDQPILSIAMTCGFPVLSTFNRQFHQKTGMSPSKYRQTGSI